MGMILICCGIFLLILDPETAISGAQEGLELCLTAVVPSLFPFFFLTVLLTSYLAGKQIPWLRPLGKLLNLPAGSESILLTGLVGGYPVGAQAVTQAWELGYLDRNSARRMLGFCSNAGPSFLFGILGPMFSSPIIPWALWAVHVLSAFFVAVVLPSVGNGVMSQMPPQPIRATGALEKSLRIMACVCGWVILFRVVIGFLNRWILWAIPEMMQYGLIGALELTNGCTILSSIENQGIRFVMAACFLAFGGCCVGMQTISVTGKLGPGYYFPGKLMQLIFSLVMALAVQWVLFPNENRITVHPIVILAMLMAPLLMALILKNRKNNSSIPVLSGV